MKDFSAMIAQLNLEEVAPTEIPPVVFNSPPVNVKFGVDADKDTVYAPFPAQIHMIDSIDFISYDAALLCMTDENTFFQLQSVDKITGAEQRCITVIPDPFVDDEQVTAITVSLPGIMSPDVLLALYQNSGKAGHHMMPTLRRGIGACEYTIITYIPHYKHC